MVNNTLRFSEAEMLYGEPHCNRATGKSTGAAPTTFYITDKSHDARKCIAKGG